MAEKKRHRPKGDGSLYQRKTDDMWVAVVEVTTYDGRRKRLYKYSKTKSKAAEKLRAMRTEQATGTLSTSGRMTVAQWLESWLKTVKLRGVRPNTLRGYRTDARAVAKLIGSRRLDTLTAHHVELMLTEIKSGRGRQGAHRVLGMALDAAVKRGLVPRNVVEAVDRPVYTPKGRTAMDLSSARRLVEAAIDLDSKPGHPVLATRWIVGLITGTRKGELLGLEWDRTNLTEVEGLLPAECMDISWQLQQVSKDHGCDPENPCGRARSSWCPQAKWDLSDNFDYRECHRTLLLSRPKTLAGMRIVPLVWPLLPLLVEHQRVTADQPNPHGLVWHHLDGRPISPREDHDYWVELLDHAGLPRVALHSMRHTMATMLQRQKTDKEVRMSIMGHSSAAAHDMYIHIDTSQQRAALKMLGESLIDPESE